MNNLNEQIQEVKEDLKKRIHAVEVSCYACADPIRKELALIEALEKRCNVLEKALDKACKRLENISFSSSIEAVNEYSRIYGKPLFEEEWKEVFQKEVNDE